MPDNKALIVMAFGLVSAMGIAGCGGDSSRRATVTVSGTVKYQGLPVADANVLFMPSNGPRASAITDAQGRYSLMTYSRNDGAVPGDFSIGITKFVQDAETKNDPVPAMKNELPEKYSNPATSGLTAKVENGKTNNFPFELVPQADEATVPAGN